MTVPCGCHFACWRERSLGLGGFPGTPVCHETSLQAIGDAQTQRIHLKYVVRVGPAPLCLPSSTERSRPRSVGPAAQGNGRASGLEGTPSYGTHAPSSSMKGAPSCHTLHTAAVSLLLCPGTYLGSVPEACCGLSLSFWEGTWAGQHSL